MGEAGRTLRHAEAQHVDGGRVGTRGIPGCRGAGDQRDFAVGRGGIDRAGDVASRIELPVDAPVPRQR